MSTIYRRNIHPTLSYPTKEEKAEYLSYQSQEQLLDIVKTILCSFPVNSPIRLVRSWFLAELPALTAWAQDYYCRVRVKTLEKAVYQYLILLASYWLVTNDLVNLSKKYNESILINATVFDELKFINPFST
jgi:hypothetical protein